MQLLNNYIQEKLKINSNSKIDINDINLDTLEEFGIKYGCKLLKDSSGNNYEFNTLNIHNNEDLQNKIKSFFKLDHSQWLDLYFKVQDYIDEINELDEHHRTSIKRSSDEGYIAIECVNLMTDIKYGYIKLYKKDDIITQLTNKKDKDKEKIDKLLIHILDFIIDEKN